MAQMRDDISAIPLTWTKPIEAAPDTVPELPSDDEDPGSMGVGMGFGDGKGSEEDETLVFPEPPWGFEPQTCGLRNFCSSEHQTAYGATDSSKSSLYANPIPMGDSKTTDSHTYGNSDAEPFDGPFWDAPWYLDLLGRLAGTDPAAAVDLLSSERAAREAAGIGGIKDDRAARHHAREIVRMLVRRFPEKAELIVTAHPDHSANQSLKVAK
jgi:hypothetical protein